MKLVTKSQLDIRQPEQMMTANKKMRIYSSASIAANHMLAAAKSKLSKGLHQYLNRQ